MQFNKEISKIEEDIKAKKIYKEMLLRNIEDKKNNIKLKESDIEMISKSINVVQEFYSNLQTDVVFKFENLITEGIKEVFETECKFEIEFKKENNNISAEFYINIGNKKIVLNDGEGGGIKDFISVLFRIIYLILDRNNKSRVIFLDENLKHLDKDRSHKALKFIYNLCKQLKIQVFFITHLDINDMEFKDQFNIICL